MKNFTQKCIWIAFILASFFSQAQDFVGPWNGSIGGLPLVFEITKTSEGYEGSMQSPKQSEAYFPLDKVEVKQDSIFLELNSFKIKYKGSLSGDEIKGFFNQGPGGQPLNLQRGNYTVKEPTRPQTPKAPFPYQIEEVVFTNSAANGIKLAGTLTLPQNNNQPPVAILISGSGPQNRNEEIFGHEPFWVLADHLTRQGIAVLRFDDRGVGESEGTQAGATSADFATDVAAAIQFLKARNDVDDKAIGLIGHSEGGLIAPIVMAAQPEDVAFFISLAGPAIKGDQVLLPQMRKSAALQGAPTVELQAEMDLMEQIFKHMNSSPKATDEELQKDLIKMISQRRSALPESLQPKYNDTYIEKFVKEFSSPWMRFFLAYDPQPNLEKITVPTLVLNGSLDYQVIASDNLPGFEVAFAKAKLKDYSIKELQGLNHLFQRAETGGSNEYALIEQTIDPSVLQLMTEWIHSRFN
ncbi:alpha/beta hydrolase family protein [Nonlabens xiamenensis]|uniref:alpha/beta hydrolase family protein n=1 Tax=Nonlabens xiamenensis TaxID=2341043 RepID=UPI000F613D4C|nr:alpha/beta fold hydrolase [Nonlabens xiamenensis]